MPPAGFGEKLHPGGIHREPALLKIRFREEGGAFAVFGVMVLVLTAGVVKQGEQYDDIGPCLRLRAAQRHAVFQNPRPVFHTVESEPVQLKLQADFPKDDWAKQGGVALKQGVAWGGEV